MAKSIKLKNNNYIDSSSVATIINDNEIYETGEVLNGKRVYAKRLVSNTSFGGLGTNQELYIPHGLNLSSIDNIWVDVSNSFLISSYKRSIPIVATAYVTNSSDELSVAIDGNNVIIIANSGWNSDWTKVVTIKFTYK